MAEIAAVLATDGGVTSATENDHVTTLLQIDAMRDALSHWMMNPSNSQARKG